MQAVWRLRGRPPLAKQTLNYAGAEHLAIIGRRWIPS